MKLTELLLTALTSYAERLEERLVKVEQLLHQHCPEVKLLQELGAITVGPLLQTDAGISLSENASSSDDDDDWFPPQLERLGGVSVNDAFIQDPTAYGLLRAASLSSGHDIRSPSTRNRFIKRPEYWKVSQYELRNWQSNNFTPFDHNCRHPMNSTPSRTILPTYQPFYTDCPTSGAQPQHLVIRRLRWMFSQHQLPSKSEAPGMIV
ncbi:hypothetical protein BKA62DRAFT_774891 [Auriculariales sp. MPI-PUGE-AT-0066]|nr:hypothetical protein BKA62DRAFT_774891 [Auriculariales sp. MPI-PUGE-AT-0066]